MAMLSDETVGARYLLAVEMLDELCPGLVEVAAASLQFLEEE